MKELIRRGLNALGLSSKPTEKNSPQYQKEKELARSNDPAVRRKLASKKTTRPEILYYLAGDEDASVRQAVAKNAATPAHADIILAKDGDVDVRLALVRRLMDLLPNVTEDKQSQLYAYAVNALATLARDEVLKVRIALSTTLKDYAYSPPSVASQLAKDAEQEVAEPMLRFCVALSDEDLLEILADHPAPWVLTAIASRDQVSEPISDVIIEAEDSESGRVLIGNEGARFYPETLQSVVQRAADIPDWQKPLVERKELPPKLALELASFVDSSLLRYLEERSDFPHDMREEIVDVVRRRIDFEKRVGTDGSLYERVFAIYSKGELDEELIGDALSWHEKDFVIASLAVLAQVNEQTVRRILETNAAKPVVALTWRADLSMRMAIKFQQELARVPQKEIMLAKGGTDYPLEDHEIEWQLEFFGINQPKKSLG